MFLFLHDVFVTIAFEICHKQLQFDSLRHGHLTCCKTEDWAAVSHRWDAVPGFHLPVPSCLLLSLLLMMVQGWWVLRVCLLFFCPSSFVRLLSWEVLHPFLLFKSKKCRRMKKGYLGKEAARQRNEGAGLLLAKDLQRELLLQDDR